MSIALKWGLITGMVNVFQSLITNLFGMGPGMKTNTGLNLLLVAVFLVITFIVIYMGIKEFRDEELHGEMNIGLAIRKGMKIALIAGLITAVYTVIYAKIIDPDMMNKIIAQAEEQWEARNMTEDQMNTARSIMNMMMNPFLLSGIAIVSTCFWGLIQSLIAGAMLKKEVPPTFPPSSPPSEPAV